MNKPRLAWTLFWIGLAFAVVLAGIAGWDLANTFRTHTSEEVVDTIWDMDGPMFALWAFSVPLGSLLAAIGAFIYTNTKRYIIWLAAVGVLGVVIVMTFIFGAAYSPPLFGIGGCLILLFFFSIVGVWMKKYAGLSIQARNAGNLKLIGYLFWLNASWFLCGEFGSLHQKVFEGRSAPSPMEIMVYLVLGWFFIALGDYKSMKLKKAEIES